MCVSERVYVCVREYVRVCGPGPGLRSGYTQSHSVNEEGTTSVSSRIQSDGMGRMGEIDEGSD
jgi:hypothetical protein